MCESLVREYGLMCEVEATLILRERYEMIKPPGESTDHRNDPQARELVLLSRKRQASIRCNLESHKARAHSA
ncbi:MAG: hypothetical protein ABL995_08770 [Bryobacteraceae bacterium]